VDPLVIRADERREVSLGRILAGFVVDGWHSTGALAILELVIPPRALVKPHRHSREDEFAYVMTGNLGCRLGDSTFEAVAEGSVVVMPRRIPHALWNTMDQPARILEVLSPAGIEDYLEELAPVLRQAGRVWAERQHELSESYGIEPLNQWIPDLTRRYGVS
jgi:uncharacterized cupin superfamily protein